MRRGRLGIHPGNDLGVGESVAVLDEGSPTPTSPAALRCERLAEARR